MKIVKYEGNEKVFPYIAYIPENISSHPGLLIQIGRAHV